MRFTAAIAILACSLSSPGAAQDAATNERAWARVDALSRGARLLVTLSTGEEREYVFERSTPRDVTLVTPQGSTDVLPKSLVIRVVRRHAHGDALENGVTIGALLGAGAVLGATVIAAKSCGSGCEGPESYKPLVGLGTLAAAGGAAIGYLVDRQRKGIEVLYEVKKQ